MAYTISGTLNQDAMVMVIDESTWLIDYYNQKSAGQYSIFVSSGLKTILAISDGYGALAYANVSGTLSYEGDRGFILCGTGTNNVEYFTISELGNASDFGDLLVDKNSFPACSNGALNRMVIPGGFSGGAINSIEYMGMTTVGGTGVDFGDLTVARYQPGAFSNKASNRAVTTGGKTTVYVNIMDYFDISITGNATDFGDMTVATGRHAYFSNGTNNRGINAGGQDYINVINYRNISTTGNASDFGDLTLGRRIVRGTSNLTNNRGVIGGGYSPSYVNIIDYITISTTGNAADFGDLTYGRYGAGSMSSGELNRGIFAGGTLSTTSPTNIIDYITISILGNAQDFGDLTEAKDISTGTENAG